MKRRDFMKLTLASLVGILAGGVDVQADEAGAETMPSPLSAERVREARDEMQRRANGDPVGWVPVYVDDSRLWVPVHNAPGAGCT